MKQFILSLSKNSLRPVVKLENWNNFRALLDTGALFPIWTAEERIINDLGGRMLKKDISFRGFGGSTKGNLYEVQKIVIGELIYPNTHIVACKDLSNVPFQLILSATMFQGLIYEIDTRHHKLNVTIPDDESNIRNLRIKDSNGRLHVLCHSRRY
ncbi:MAG: retropepsin-like domain-containing protein [Eubacterium sp.]|nr:retropepsin-like domain-containing protein [Eubacterium sp.]